MEKIHTAKPSKAVLKERNEKWRMFVSIAKSVRNQVFESWDDDAVQWQLYITLVDGASIDESKACETIYMELLKLNTQGVVHQSTGSAEWWLRFGDPD